MQCALIVRTSVEDDKGFTIDERLNNERFEIQTNKSLLFLTTNLKTLRSPTMKFRAIVTAEGRFL
jgi:hypothetical protein